MGRYLLEAWEPCRIAQQAAIEPTDRVEHAIAGLKWWRVLQRFTGRRELLLRAVDAVADGVPGRDAHAKGVTVPRGDVSQDMLATTKGLRAFMPPVTTGSVAQSSVLLMVTWYPATAPASAGRSRRGG